MTQGVLNKKGNMNTAATQKVELKQTLDKIPEDRLAEAQKLLNSLVEKKKSGNRGSLSGIWKGTEFEKLDDENLEEDLKALRKEMSESLLSKKL